MKLQTTTQHNGFTLLELLVVLVILGLLVSIVGPQVLKQVGTSKGKTAALQIEEFEAALGLFRLEVGRFPTSQEGLDALVHRPVNARAWSGPYVSEKVISHDPWGNPYVYRFPGINGAYDLYSLGADGSPGGEGEDADVVSWE